MGQLDVNDTHVVGRMGVEERSKVPLAERSWVA